jgi:exodeoxyribonuclease (lambda-induced)
MLQIHQVAQNSPEWFALRKQYPLTASNAQAIGNNGKGLETLCWEKLSEKYSSGVEESFSNKETKRGNDLEPDARELYELETSNVVTQVGFVTDDEISPIGGASPDSFVNDDGLLEIKCFADAKHFKLIVDYKKTGKFEIESQYLWQMNQQMLFTGRKYVDFLAYNPNFSQSLLIQRVEADPEKIEKIKEGLAKGLEIINGIESSLK